MLLVFYFRDDRAHQPVCTWAPWCDFVNNRSDGYAIIKYLGKHRFKVLSMKPFITEIDLGKAISVYLYSAADLSRDRHNQINELSFVHLSLPYRAMSVIRRQCGWTSSNASLLLVLQAYRTYLIQLRNIFVFVGKAMSPGWTNHANNGP